jgi:thiamine kinase-like enzyme
MLDTAQCVLSTFLGAETARCTALEPIHGGASSASLYQFGHNGQRYVLRLLAPMSARSKHHHEVRLTRAAGGLGVGPYVHFVAADESALIYDYTPGQTLSLDDVHQTPVMERLARQLSRLHSAKVEVPTAMSPFERFYEFEQRTIEGGRPWPQAMTRAAEFVKQLDRQLQHTASHPCHLDLHARNIILTPAGAPVLIDWVNGGLSDPAFDVATLLVFLGLKNRNRDHFLASYQASMNEDLELARVELLMPIRPFVAAASSLKNTPSEVSLSQLEQELIRDEPPFCELFYLPPHAQPTWPSWKWGLSLLKMGLSHLP